MPTRPSFRRRRHCMDVSTWSTTRGEAAATHLDETTLGYSAVDELAQMRRATSSHQCQPTGYRGCTCLCSMRLRAFCPRKQRKLGSPTRMRATAGPLSVMALGSAPRTRTPAPIRSGGLGSPQGGRARQTPISSPLHNVVKPGPGPGDCHQSHELLGRARRQRRWP